MLIGVFTCEPPNVSIGVRLMVEDLDAVEMSVSDGVAVSDEVEVIVVLVRVADCVEVVVAEKLIV